MPHQYNTRKSDAYLFSFNEKNFNLKEQGKWKESGDFSDYSDLCSKVKQGHTYIEDWNCANKNAEIGDEAFVVKVGNEPRGIFAHGTIVKVYKDDGKVDIKFDTLLDYDKDNILDMTTLENLSEEQHWSPQNSGIAIKCYFELKEAWSNLLKK